MSVDDAAKVILNALGPPLDKDKNPIAVTAQMKAYADAVISTYKAAMFANAPGTITGTAAPGGPLMVGTGAGGIVTGMSPSTWLGKTQPAFGGATTLSQEAAASTTYLMSSSIIVFAPGDITGTCTATATSPGILLNGAGSGGKITGLVGTAWAAAVLGAIGIPGPLGAAVYTALAGYIMANADCSYSSGSVVGTFSAGAGPLVAGAGTGGMIQ